jgi:hypothetical protein
MKIIKSNNKSMQFVSLKENILLKSLDKLFEK